jgi:hypothetical protein
MSMKLTITAATIFAVLAVPALASARDYPKQSHYGSAFNSTNGSDSNGSRGAPESINKGGFAGWPTDYVTNRFGDRQLQGR